MADLESEIARLRRDVDELLARIPGSSKTTKSQRTAMRKHIEKLDKLIANNNKAKQKKPKKIVVNTFAAGQIVEIPDNILKRKGKILILACHDALPSIRKCIPKACGHKSRDYVWVQWPSTKIISYHFSKLKLMTEDDLKQRIGNELSGRVGAWVFDAVKKTWKKDGDDKEYSNDEFSDIMDTTLHPYAKDDAHDLLIDIMRFGS